MFSSKLLFPLFIILLQHSASEQIPPLFSFDDFDECFTNESNLYCTFEYQMSSNSSIWNSIQKLNSNPKNYRHDILRHGICLQNQNISSNITEKIQHKYELIGLSGTVASLHCQDKKWQKPIDKFDISFIAFVTSYVIFVISASFYERFTPTKSDTNFPVFRILSSFSLRRNFFRLSTVQFKDDDQKLLSCIQGVRFYNMLCVILSHTIMVQLGAPIANPFYTEQIHFNFFNAFLTNGGYVVQSFFLISGWLLIYNVFKAFEKKEFTIFDVALIIITRYLRLTPTMMMVLFFHCTWLAHLSPGPFWHKLLWHEYENCRRNWWTNLLYVNNFVDNKNMCLQQTWYLATDMQLFISFLTIIYMMKKFPKFKMIFFILPIVLGILIPATISYIQNYDILIRQYPEPLYNFLLTLPEWHIMYSAPYSNITGYGLGLIFGYIFYNIRNKIYHPSKWVIFLWWLSSFGLPLFIILIGGGLQQKTYTRLESSLYWGFGKLVFALGIAIGILGFTKNIGWFALWVCRWKPMQILGRLTYSTYLVHATVIRTRMVLQHRTLYTSDALFFFSFLGDVTVAYLAATLLTLLVEMPLSALQKLIFERNSINDK